MNYGTVIVDLERHQVVNLLADRSAASTAEWLLRHKEVEVVSRARAGLYADGARQGAPPARQVADRFHLLQNFRETVERQLGRFEAPIRATAVLAETDEDGAERPGVLNPRGEIAEQQRSTQRGRNAARQALFDQIRTLFEAGGTVREIARELGLGRRRVERWVRLIAVPERNTMAPKVCTPAYFGTLLARRWAEGTTTVRVLLAEILQHGYTGSHGHLARFLVPWRNAAAPHNRVPTEAPSASNHEAHAPLRLPALDPMTGHEISPLTAAALCVKPRGQMTDRPDRQCRRTKGGLGGIHHDAPVGDAVPRPASWRDGWEAGCLAGRCAPGWHLWNAAFRADVAAGYRRGSQCYAGTMEQQAS